MLTWLLGDEEQSAVPAEGGKGGDDGDGLYIVSFFLHLSTTATTSDIHETDPVVRALYPLGIVGLGVVINSIFGLGNS